MKDITAEHSESVYKYASNGRKKMAVNMTDVASIDNNITNVNCPVVNELMIPDIASYLTIVTCLGQHSYEACNCQ